MHLTPDGQLTIPPEICQQMGISVETELEFEIESNRLYIQKKPTADAMATWITAMRGSMPNLTTDQVMSLTRDDETV
jgi:bifunctional DNA-binding transcriptional regulator/antitoxin component of YhaV-PrlF toxin-antitoxin module